VEDVGIIATEAEVREGVALLKHAARETSVEMMDQITATLVLASGRPGADDAALRAMLETLVAATDATPIEAPDSLEDFTSMFESDSAFEQMLVAAGARTRLAKLLEEGTGGPADIGRAKAYYTEALKAAQDYEAYLGLQRLGVDVSEYDGVFAMPEEEPPAPPPEE
jgi:hypothetical protein